MRISDWSSDVCSSDLDDLARWSRLTEKHRACLDLLLERMTSKEIARVLDVAKATVDQRLTAARSILGVTSRDKAAIESDRKSVVSGKSVSVRVDLGGRRIIQ